MRIREQRARWKKAEISHGSRPPELVLKLGGCRMAFYPRLERDASAQHDFGAFADRSGMSAASVRPCDDNPLDEAVHQPTALLDRQARPGAQQIAVAELLRQGRLRAGLR